MPVAGRVEVTLSAGQVTEPAGGHDANLLIPGRLAGQLDGPGQGVPGDLGLAVQAGQVAGRVSGEGDEFGQAEQRLVRERGQQVEDLVRADGTTSADLLGRLQGGTAGEDREPAPERALGPTAGALAAVTSNPGETARAR